MPQYSQFVQALPEYLHVNRMTDYVELYRLLRAGDGELFDAHFHNLLEQQADPDFGLELQPLSRIETDRSGPLERIARPAARFPQSFELLREIARVTKKDTFVELMMGPSAVHVPPAERYGVAATWSSDDLRELREQFATGHRVRLGRIIREDLLAELARQVAVATFREIFHDPLGVDHTMDFGPTQAMLHYLVTDSRLMEMVEYVGGIKPGSLNRFSGRIYQMITERDRDGYHSDVHLQDRRVVAISVSMTEVTPTGGDVVMRRRGWVRPFGRIAPVDLGEAALFRISRHLLHKVADVRSGSRTNLAGWFCAREGYDYEGWLEAPVFGGGDDGFIRTLARRLFATT